MYKVLGISALPSENGSGAFDKDVRYGTCQDQDGIRSAKYMVKRAIDLVNLLKNKG